MLFQMPISKLGHSNYRWNVLLFVGIPVGKITKLDKIEGSGYYSINAELFDDPSQIYYDVLENIDFQELQSLQKKLPQ